MAARFRDVGATGSVDVAARASAVAGALLELGVGRGERVLLSCEPSVDTVVAYAAILRAGAIVVPANTAYTERELRHIVDDVRPTLAIADDPSRFAGLVRAIDLEVAESRGGSSDPETRRSARDDDPAMIAYTSGTTGAPKGAVLTHGNLLASARAVVEAWRWTADDTLVLALPLFHMHGLGVGVNGTIVAGARAVVLPRFDADAVFDAIAESAATMFFGVPTMYARLAAHPRLGELASLRLCVSGSAPLPPSLWQTIRDGSGQAVLERYGMSETAMLTSNPYEGERRPGTVGVPLPNVEVRLGEANGVEVCGPNVFGGYWERPAATAAAFTGDGWFRTGDVGERDAEGYLRLIGRTSELIITGGYNVYPREVEDVLRAHPSLADAAVVGLADETWGERVVAFVVPASGADPSFDDLDEHCARHLAGYKRPRAWTVVDELPRNAMGKVRRDELTQREG